MTSLSISTRRFRSPIGLIVAAIACVVTVGCGGDKSNRMSGKVTFKGQPVPAGTIYFIPDASKGNQGPTGYAMIKDGAYDTSETGGQGAANGPMIIAIEGQDPKTPGKADKDNPDVAFITLFPRYETALEVSGDTEKDFVVPAEAAKGPSRPKGPAVVNP